VTPFRAISTTRLVMCGPNLESAFQLEA
jgi:hypothetical protein